MTLAQVRARVDLARATGGEALAIALLDLAEAEPILGHRQPVVRAPLEEAAALVDRLAEPALEGRILLRLAHVKLADGDFEGVEQLVGRARDRVAGDLNCMLDAGTLLARTLIRRKDFAAAETRLVEVSDATAEEPTTLAGRRAVMRLALGWVELAVEQGEHVRARERLDVFPSMTPDEDQDELLETDFASRQLRAAMALALGDHQRACVALREAVAIAKRVDAVEDELEMRIALAGALVQRDDQVGRDEAEKHLQVARDSALEHGLDSLRMAALVGQVGLLTQKGQTQAALDRCLEIAQSAVSQGDLPRYASAVALMSQIYEMKGDLASAYRTFAEAHGSLKDKLGSAATDLFRPYIAALADRIGPETFADIAEKVNQAARARQTFRSR